MELVDGAKRKPSPENTKLSKYTIKSIPRGRCLIISNKSFVVKGERSRTEHGDLTDRDGTEHDVENLRKTFEWLQFEVEVANDCPGRYKSENSLFEKITKYSDMNHDKYDCFVCCILSHGSLGKIYGTDGNFITVEKIRELFRSDECATLHNKPKLFFIQACRGEKEDQGRRIQSDSVVLSNTSGSSQPFKVLSHDSDFLFAYATTPGM